MDPKEELSQELRRARGWILAVGLIMFAVDMIMLQVQGDRLLPGWKTKLMVLDFTILAYFIALWWFAKSYPKQCCVLALVGFWGLHIGLAVWSGDFESLIRNGIIMKILFTVALIRGLKSATRATYLKEELERVFG